MAIDPVVGGFSEYLVSLTTSQTYNRWRNRLYQWALKLGITKEDKKGNLIRFNNSLKAVLTSQHNIFEGLNIRYFGPVDGHDVLKLVKIFQDIKDFRGPKVIHIKTKKGKGFKPAEDSVTEWHAPGIFDKETGERITSAAKTDTPPLFQDVFGHTLVELARENEKIIGVTPAMSTGCSMSFLMHEMPERTFDVGIAEGHAVTFSAGLAKEGMLPFCNIYSSFMQRAYDNVIHDVALQNLDMVMCLDRAGLVGSDGVTHHGTFDLAAFRCIPNLIIASPLNEEELRNMMYTAQLKGKGAFIIRYPRGKGVLVDWHKPMQEIPVGKGVCLKEGTDMAVLTLGPIGNIAAEAINKAEEKGLSIAHYDMRFLRPLDEELLHHIGKSFKKVITIEDGTKKGGFGSSILEFFADNGYNNIHVKRIGIPDEFIEHGTPEELYRMLDMDVEGIYNVLVEVG